MRLERLVVGQLQVNCYLVACEETREALIVDPGAEARRILASVEDAQVRVTYIILTHFHFDHIMAVSEVREGTGARVCIHEAEADLLKQPPLLFRMMVPTAPRDLEADRLLHEGDTLTVGQHEVRVLHTPGHSPGGISLWLPVEQTVFCGDLIFRQGVGRSDFPGSSAETLVQSIRERIYTLPDATALYPGHGPETTVGYEKRYNPWVRGEAS